MLVGPQNISRQTFPRQFLLGRGDWQSDTPRSWLPRRGQALWDSSRAQPVCSHWRQPWELKWLWKLKGSPEHHQALVAAAPYQPRTPCSPEMSVQRTNCDAGHFW